MSMINDQELQLANRRRVWMSSVASPRHVLGAHGVSNPMYATLINAIKARANAAPASEGWPAACK